MSFLGSNIVPRPMGTSFPTIVPYRVFHTSDREIAIAVGSEKLWAAFCSALERPDLERHPDYETNALRIQNRKVLEPILSDIFRQRPVEQWLARLQSAGVPCSLVRNFGEVVDHPQCEVREMFPFLDHPTAGKHRVTGTPVKLSTHARPSVVAGSSAGPTHKERLEGIVRARRLSDRRSRERATSSSNRPYQRTPFRNLAKHSVAKDLLPTPLNRRPRLCVLRNSTAIRDFGPMQQFCA